jgi:hypothetical protein
VLQIFVYNYQTATFTFTLVYMWFPRDHIPEFSTHPHLFPHPTYSTTTTFTPPIIADKLETNQANHSGTNHGTGNIIKR